ncbi:Fe(III)-pyochelin receptor [Chlamydia trachomatis]|nr:Fe(III)-pyochelin receptor [Chlamydia trachomatis]
METMKVPTISLDHPSEYTRLIYDGGLSASYHADKFLLKGQLSSHFVNARYDVDQDGSPADAAFALQKEKQRFLSQELSMIGKNEGWYNWNLGLFAFQQKINRDVDVMVKLPKLMHTLRLNDQFTWGVSLYHQSKFSISEELKVEAGARIDYEKSRLAYSESKNGKKSESENSLPFIQVSPKISCQYFIVPDFQVYATVTKGYVTGGFNTVYVGTENRSYNAEHSWNYEVGAKGEIIPNRLTAELVGFAVTTRDKQLSKIIPNTGQVTYNAGASRSVGLEASFDAQLTKQWGLSASYGYTNAKFTEYVSDKGVDFGGKFLPFVPEHTLAVNTQYQIPFSGRLLDSATIHLGYKGIGDMYWHEDNKAMQDFYQLLDASLSLKRAGITCTLWGTNLLNSQYLGYFYKQGPRNMGKPGAPLKAGVTVELNF